MGELLESNSLMNVEANRVCTKFCIVEAILKKFATKETATHALLVEIECTLQSGCQL